MRKYEDITVKELQELTGLKSTNKPELYKKYSTMGRYSKRSILDSRKFKNRVDLLDIILKDDKMYTIGEVESKIDSFMNKTLKGGM